MSLSHLLKKFNPPSPSRATSPEAGTGLPSDNLNGLPQPRRDPTEPSPIMPRRWRKKTSSTDDRLSSSPPTRTSTPPLRSTVGSPTTEAGPHEMPMPMPLPAGPSFFLSNLSMEPVPETVSGSSPTSDKLTEAWNMVKDGPSDSNLNQRLNALGAF